MAKAESEEEFDSDVQELKNNDIWKDPTNQKLLDWFTKTSLNQHKASYYFYFLKSTVCLGQPTEDIAQKPTKAS